VSFVPPKDPNQVITSFWAKPATNANEQNRPAAHRSNHSLPSPSTDHLSNPNAAICWLSHWNNAAQAVCANFKMHHVALTQTRSARRESRMSPCSAKVNYTWNKQMTRRKPFFDDSCSWTFFGTFGRLSARAWQSLLFSVTGMPLFSWRNHHQV
jgi:hypothetical protein